MKLKIKDVELELPDGCVVSVDDNKVKIEALPPARYPFWVYPTYPAYPPVAYPPHITYTTVTGPVTPTIGTYTVDVPDGILTSGSSDQFTFTVSN